MDRKEDSTPSDLWKRRSNNTRLNLSTNKTDGHDPSPNKRFGSASGHSKNNPFNTVGPISITSVASPTSAGASSAFGLGSGAFASFGSANKTPKTPGAGFNLGKSGEKKDSFDEGGKDTKRPPARKSLSSLRSANPTVEASSSSARPASTEWALRHTWVVYYRPPTSKNSDYEKSIVPMCRIPTAQAFWKVYCHLKRPSVLPTVSDYHFFKEGIRPVWEDEENKRGGKWLMRLKKGVADRYWEDLLLAMVGDQFAEASEEVCGAVVSVRSGEDVFSIWTKNDGGRNVKIRETIKRVLSLPADTNLEWRSHDESINTNQAREKANQEKRRNTIVKEEAV